MGSKKGFTLAEVLIVLSVIGVLCAILLPAARNCTPDENAIKFKKGNIVLGNVIRELISSDKYYLDGDFGTKPDGSLVDSDSYFCKTFSDVLNAKEADCYEKNTNHPGVVDIAKGTTLTSESIEDRSSVTITAENLEKSAQYLDETCRDFTGKSSTAHSTTETEGAQGEILTSDGIRFWEINPHSHFGLLQGITPKRRFSNPNEFPANYPDENGFDRMYKIICMDVDEINKGQDAFGYGIRADGKIFYGKLAKEWMKKEIQNKD